MSKAWHLFQIRVLRWNITFSLLKKRSYLQQCFTISTALQYSLYTKYAFYDLHLVVVVTNSFLWDGLYRFSIRPFPVKWFYFNFSLFILICLKRVCGLSIFASRWFDVSQPVWCHVCRRWWRHHPDTAITRHGQWYWWVRLRSDQVSIKCPVNIFGNTVKYNYSHLVGILYPNICMWYQTLTQHWSSKLQEENHA